VVAWEDGLTNRLALSLSLSPSRTLVTPTASAPPVAQDNTSHGFSPLCSISRQPIWAGTRRDNFTHRSRDPPGSKRQQLARQVGACCVLTNNFLLSSRWVVSSNLFSPGCCSILGVSSSCPSTAAMTWFSFLRRATATMAVVNPPDGGGIDDFFPHGGRATSGPVPSPSPLSEEEAGQPWPNRRRHLVGCQASRRCRRPSGGHIGR
jgi:hypothetical protein